MRKVCGAVFAVLAFAVAAFAGPYDAWSKYRVVTINTTGDAGGAGVATAQTNFPVLVRLTSDSPATGADVLAEALAGGADIRFSDETGAVALPFEIDHWSATSAAIWVRVPVVEGNAETDIRLYWGSAFSASESNSISVFNTSNRYRAVWHLNETASPSRDATSFGTDAVWMNSPAGGAGNIGGSVNIANPNGTSSANGKYLRAAYNTANDNFKMNAIDGLTVSAWVNRTSNNGEANQGIAGRWNWNGGNRRQYILEANGTSWQFAVSQTGTNAEETVGSTPVVNGEWTHLAATYRDGEQTLYVNGVATDTRALDPYSSIDSAWAAAPFLIGRMETNNCCLQGIDARIDEVRLADTTRSPEWIKLGYETKKPESPSVFGGATKKKVVTFAETIPAPIYVVDSEIFPNTPVVNGTVTNITVSPALPAGLMLDPLTGVISGTPTAATAEGVYTVTAQFSAPDTTVTTDLTITVNPLAPTDLEYPVANVIYGLDIEIEDNVPSVSSLTDPNQMVANFSVSPALPAGLSLNATTGVISGTPTEVSVEKVYTVTASNATGSTTAQLTIAVTPPPSALAYSNNPVVYTGGLAAPIVPNKPSVTGLVTSWSITPALPAGMNFDTATGIITGVPMGSASGPFTVSATNVAGSAEALLELSVTDPEDYSEWPSVAEFHLSTAAVGVTETQKQFPLLVRLTSAHADIFNGALGDGADIRFSKHDGTRLAYEVDHYDDVAQSAAFWVLVDEIEGNSTLDLHIHWGNAGATSLVSGGRVFNTANGFLSVYHMGGDQTTPRPNAVAGRNPATPANLPAGYTDRAGVIGRADTLGVSTANRRNVDHFHFGPVTAQDLPTSHLTISMWIGTPSSMPGPRHAFTIAGAGNDKQNNVYIARRWNDNVDFNAVAAGNGDELGVGACCWIKGNWQLLHAVLDGGVRRVYQNGVLIGQSSAQAEIGILDRQHALIGATLWADGVFPAAYDEVRLANVVRTADWARLEYQTQVKDVVPLADLTYSQASYTFVEESPITPITVAGLKGTAESYSISPALPPSLTLNTETGEITGTPDNGLVTKTFTVTAHNGSWSTSTTFDLTITSLPPAGVAYSTNPVVYRAGLAAAPIVPTYTGTITSWSVSPALPAGLILNPQTGAISGEPVVATAAAVYVVTGTGPEGSTTVDVNLTVLPPSEDFSTWSNNRSITLNTSASGSDVANTVTNFPLLVRLGAAEASIFTQALAGGADVRFAKANGITRLPYEIVTWDADAKKAEIWVKVDTVYGNNATQSIKMFWGKAGAADSSDGTRVFTAANGYVTTFHMGNPVGGGDPATTARPNSVNPGTNDAMPAFIGAHPDVITEGVIGKADRLRGQGSAANGDHFNFGTLPATNYPDGLTLSMWAKPYGYTGNFVQFYTIGNINDGAGVPAHTVWLGKRQGGNDLSAEVAGSSRIDAVAGQGTAALNVWQYYSYSVLPGGAGARLYRNGVEVAQTVNTQNLANVARTANFIGRANWGDNTFDGLVDEVRFSNKARSADFVKLEHASQKTYQTLTDIGLQPPVISYAATALNGTAGLEVAAQTPTITGPVGAPLTITPALPDGMSLDEITGQISGTPTGLYGPVTHTITASNAGGSSSDTIQITVVAPPVPAAPVIVSPTNNATGVTIHPLVVSWETVAAPVTHYQLQGTEDGTFMDIHVDTIVADTFFVAHDAPHDRELHVRVRAVNVGGEGPWTAITFRTIEAPPSISYDPDTVNYPLAIAITPLEVTADPDSGPATSFSITPELPAGLDFDTETGAITGTPTAVTEATDYTVIASGPGGFDTTLVRIAVIPVAPGVVTNVEATTGVSQASVAFTAPVFDGGAAITSYTVTSHPGNITASGPTSPIVVAGLTATVPYTFTVTATNSAGTGVASDTSGPVAPYNVPGAPLTVTGLAGNTQVTVSWAAPESDSGSVITGYTVTSNPEGKTCSTSGAVTTQCIVTGLTNGTAYTFSVTATNAAGTGAESAPSAAITPTPDPTAPSAPLNVAGTPGNGEVVVTWDAPLTDGDSEITGYTVTATPGGATCAWTTGELTCTVTGLTNGTAYTFAVIATNAIGSSQPATSAGVTPRTVPGVATNVVATAGALQASVAFTAPDGNGGSPITSYTVTAHPGGQTATGPASPINVTGLTAGTDYRFTVVATNAAGNGAASDTSDAVTPYTVPDAPTAIAATPGNAQATVTFTAPAGDGGSAITGYKVTAHPGGITATEGASPVVVTGLTNGTTYTFTVRAINAAGEGAASDTSAAVTPNAPPVIAYTPSTLSFPALAAVTPVTPASTGGPVTSWSVTPDLPAGLSLNTENGAISGTPTTVVAAADYKVIAHGALGKDSVTLNIAVTANPPVIAYNPGTVNFTRGQAITPPALASTGGPVTTWSIAPALPAGLTFNTETGAFSGTPTAVSAAADYTVTASNSTGSATATVNITVLPGLPVIAYSGSPKSFIKGVADSLLVTSTGGAVASYSIAPALPAGLTLNTTTGRIAGTPTGASAAANYTVTATNASGTATATVNITVVDMTPVISYAFTTLSFTRGQAITNLTPVSTGGSVTAYAAEPALPGGITLNATTGVISGNPTAASAAANYRIIASNAYGKDTVTLNITVLPGLPVIAYSGSPKTFIKGVADSLLVNSTGGVVASYAVAPALPAGLTLNTTTGRIAGTPTGASAAANYTVTATNASGTATATVNITVVDLTPVVSYTALTDSFTVGIAVTKNATSTGGAVTEWTVTPALPAGLALNGTTGSITGTPTTPSAAANYTVIAKNAYGADTLVLNLKVLQSTAIMGGAYTFRVSGVEKPYAFVLPAGAATTEKVTMLITDVTGRTVWTKAVRPNTNGTATEVVWTGRTSSGMLASAGMYVVRISVLDNGKTTEYVRKSVTLKSR